MAIFDDDDREHHKSQLLRLVKVMQDQQWRTNTEFSKAAGVPENSATAALRSLRSDHFGNQAFKKRLRKGTKRLWEYQLVLNEKWPDIMQRLNKKKRPEKT